MFDCFESVSRSAAVRVNSSSRSPVFSFCASESAALIYMLSKSSIYIVFPRNNRFLTGFPSYLLPPAFSSFINSNTFPFSTSTFFKRSFSYYSPSSCSRFRALSSSFIPPTYSFYIHKLQEGGMKIKNLASSTQPTQIWKNSLLLSSTSFQPASTYVPRLNWKVYRYQNH